MKSKMINGYPHIAYEEAQFDEDEMLNRSEAHLDWQNKRRSVRDISEKPFSKEILENIIQTASTAPSGANKQPWTFCVVSSSEMKKQVREAAELEEKISYNNRMSKEWLDDLKPLATNWEKPFLEKAPYLIVVFKRVFENDEEGVKHNNYYVNESVGIACGMLISAIHNAGLVTLTHTPSPMNFLANLLNRPVNERPFLLLPVGYAEKDAYVPDIKRKGLDEIVAYY